MLAKTGKQDGADGVRGDRARGRGRRCSPPARRTPAPRSRKRRRRRNGRSPVRSASTIAASLQRGLKVYKEVCSACHSLNYIAFRNLADPGGPGYSAAQAAAFASEYKIKDGPNDQGEMFDRPGRPADYFPAPFPNEQAARAANGGALPPDLSLITKARSYERGFPQFIFDFFTQFQEQGPNYVDAILQGFEDKPPAGVTIPDGSYYNKYFPGHAIKMPKPLSDGQVTFDDGSPATVAQYAKDVTTFLMWAAEPHMEARKRIGLQVFVFLILFTGLMYFTKKKVWADAH